MLSVGPSTTSSLAEPAPLEVSPTSQGPKRYLKDFPDSVKTYIPEKHLTQVRDDFGNILEVEDHLKNRLVLEDPSETRLQKLVRISVLTNYRGLKHTALQKSIEAEFPSSEVCRAVVSVYNEIHGLYPPELREAESLSTRLILVKRYLNDMQDSLDKHAAPPKTELTPWNIFCFLIVVTTIVALGFFSIRALIFELKHLISLLSQNNTIKKYFQAG